MAEIDPANLTDEQVKNLSAEEADELLRKMSAVDPNPPVDEENPAPVEEEPKEAEEPPAEAEPEAKPDEEPPKEAAEVPEGDNGEQDDFDIQENYRQEFELLTKRAEAAEKRHDVLAGTYGSKVDELRKELERLRAGQVQPEGDDNYGEPARPQPAPTSPDLSRLQQLEAYQKQQVVESTYNTFLQEVAKRYEDEIKGSPTWLDEFQAALQPKVQERLAEYQQIAGQIPADKLGKLARMVLDSAHTDYQLERIRAARAEALKRKAEQVPKHRRAKVSAASSKDSAAKASVPKPKPVEEWTAEEADEWLKRASGEGQRRRH